MDLVVRQQPQPLLARHHGVLWIGHDERVVVGEVLRGSLGIPRLQRALPRVGATEEFVLGAHERSRS